MTVASFLRVTALVAGALVATAPLASQDAPPRRLKLSDTGLPGIDLGLQPLARLDAIGGRSRVRTLEAPPGPWVAGRVLVKFRDRDHAETVAIDPAADPDSSVSAATSSSRSRTTARTTTSIPTIRCSPASGT